MCITQGTSEGRYTEQPFLDGRVSDVSCLAGRPEPTAAAHGAPCRHRLLPRRAGPQPAVAQFPEACRPCQVPEPGAPGLQGRETSRPESRPCRARVLVPFLVAVSCGSSGFTFYTVILKAPPLSYWGIFL